MDELDLLVPVNPEIDLGLLEIKEYEIMVYYDAVTGYRINTEVETIYIDNEDNRWYFPYDDDKFHKHDGIRMVFEKNYDEEDK